jgi:glycosyltransferase involved in cell wall biosynthesis
MRADPPRAMPEAIRLCAIVPVFDHAGPLPGVLERLRAAGLPVFVVDDGSGAECARTIDACIAADPSRTLVRLPENSGKGAAVQAGFPVALAAGYTHVLQVDADGQHDLAALPALVAAAVAEPRALVSGRPQYDESVPKSRLYGRYLTHGLVWLNTLSFAIVDSMCGFRIYPLASSIAACRRWRIGRRMDFDTDLMLRMYWMGVPMRFVPVPVHYPEDGVSHFDLLRDNLRMTSLHVRHVLHLLWRVLTLRPRPDRLERQGPPGTVARTQ